ncbi:hypothetical protein OIO90_004174 [Microbotryomycetes sp. JL221]|nr:hypothetical protein OIO90_004174 [Microbotryomycetes sp. JL221]
MSQSPPPHNTARSPIPRSPATTSPSHWPPPHTSWSQQPGSSGGSGSNDSSNNSSASSPWQQHRSLGATASLLKGSYQSSPWTSSSSSSPRPPSQASSHSHSSTSNNNNSSNTIHQHLSSSAIEHGQASWPPQSARPNLPPISTAVSPSPLQGQQQQQPYQDPQGRAAASPAPSVHTPNARSSFEFDPLLGPRPTSAVTRQTLPLTNSNANSASSSMMLGEQTPRPSGSQTLHGSDYLSQQRVMPPQMSTLTSATTTTSSTSSMRPVQYDEDGSERMARVMMEGLGLSADGSLPNSPQPGSVLHLDDSNRPRRSFESSDNDERWTQHYHQNAQSTRQQGSGGEHHDSGSSQAGLMSPLSPHVEPFSPATSASGASAWGASGASAGSRADREREPSMLDLRASGYPQSSQQQQLQQQHQQQSLQHQQQQQQQPQKLGLPRVTDASFASASPSHLQSASRMVPSPFADRGAFSQPQPMYPASAMSLAPQHGSDGGSDFQGPSVLPVQQMSQPPPQPQPQPANTIPALSGFAMTHSTSRDGFMHQSPPTLPHGVPGHVHPTAALAAGLSASATSARREREIPTDRGGYVRPGYAEASARGTLSMSGPGGIGPTGQAGVGSNSTIQDPSEEISTIFVVGFPEDMMEREFQNMFVFANGFQAATLKIPASTVVARERERELATAAAVNAAVGGSLGNIQGYPDHLIGAGVGGPESVASAGSVGGTPYDEPFLSAGGIEAPYSSPLGPIVSRDSAGSPAGQRKQIIGFAKFNTRIQAMEARDVLNGRKIDADKGTQLKAEMAKKNLHTKRGPSADLGSSFPVAGLDPQTIARLGNVGTLSPALLAEMARQSAAAAATSSNAGQHHQQYQSSVQSHSDPSSSGPTTGQQTPQQWQESNGVQNLTRLPEQQQHNQHQQFQQQQQLYQQQQQQYQQQPSQTTAPPALPQQPQLPPHQAPAQRYDEQDQTSWSRRAFSQERRVADASPDRVEHLSTSPPARGFAQHQQQQQQLQYQQLQGGNLMMQQLDADSRHQSQQLQQYGASPYQSQQAQSQPQMQYQEQTSVSSRSQPSLYDGSGTASPANLLLPASTTNRLMSPNLQGFNPSSPLNGHAIASPMLGPQDASGGGNSNQNGLQIPRTQNPADMNAPKNTLYVGGLPAVLPSLTGPFSAAHLEDNLRNAFSRCPGFRRLSFRAKSNGPIVFVEFEDTHFATRALQEMYGNTLGGLVKGGIRLSYSKNPLGVRSATVGPNGAASPASVPGFGPSSPMPGRRSTDSPHVNPADFRAMRSPPLPPPSHTEFTQTTHTQSPLPHTTPSNGPSGFAGTFSPFG